MKHKVLKFQNDIYCIIRYRTIFGIPVYFKAKTFDNQNDFLDDLYKLVTKPEPTIPELIKEKERLQAEIDQVCRKLREKLNIDMKQFTKKYSIK